MQLGIPGPKQCERCGVSFLSVHVTKRYCTDRCARRASEKRRRKARVRERRDAKAAELKQCKDCATTEGMNWWVGRMQKPGSASARCHVCYLAYWRATYRRRQEAKGLTVRSHADRLTQPGPRRDYSPEEDMTRTCVVCGSNFQRRKNQNNLKVCSDICRQVTESAKNRRKNNKRRNAKTSEQYSVADIVRRDGDKCHLCGKRVNMSLSGMHQMGPTVDHLLPIVAGGLDELANVRLAHRSCNVARGAGGTVQLMAFG